LNHTEDADPVLPGNAIVHGACGSWWTGASRAHCPACHRTFSGESAADRHRIGTPGVDRRCLHPLDAGLVARRMPYGTLWGWPAPDGFDLRRGNGERVA
jgi:hypothetical protein